MDQKEAVRKLKDLSKVRDEEVSHIEADDTLLEFLDTNGFSDVADEYRNTRATVGFWYA